MNSDLKPIALLFGQLSSTIFALVIIWVWGDTDEGKKVFSLLLGNTLLLKVLLSVFVLLFSGVGLFKIMKTMINKANKGDNNE